MKLFYLRVLGQTLPLKRDYIAECATKSAMKRKKSYAVEKLQEHNLNRWEYICRTGQAKAKELPDTILSTKSVLD